MPGPATYDIGIQKLRKDGTVSYVQVALSTLTDPPHQPTAAELATLRSDLPSGYTYTQVGSTSAATYARILYVGNSITLHGGAGGFVVNDANPKRGMAATAPDKDYVRVLTALHKIANPTADARTLGSGTTVWGVGEETISAVTGPFLEGKITASNGAEFYNELTPRFNAVTAWAPKILYMRLGENIDDGAIASIGQGEFQARYKALIDKIVANDTACKVVLSTSVWPKPNFDIAMRAIAVERGYPLADFSDMWPNRFTNGYYALNQYDGNNNPGGIAAHPNDAGMARIAEGLWAKTPGGPVVVPPVVPPANSTSGFYGYRGDSFNYAPLADSSTSDPFPVFETDKIKVVLALRDQTSSSNEPGMGGAVYKIFNKAKPDHTLVYNAGVWNGENNPGFPGRIGTPNRIFTGQGLSECLYQNPRPYYTTGETGQGPHDATLGYNPNEIGDDVMASGRRLKYGASGNRFFVETRPMLYGQTQAPASEVTMRKWGEVADRALILNYETTFARTAQVQAVNKGQEAPCLYVNNLHIFKFYNGNNPYANDGITTFVAPFSNYGNALGNQPGNKNGQRNGGQYVTEPWIGLFGNDGYGIALMLKDNIRSFIGYFGDSGGNNASPNLGGSYGYIAHAMNEILDMNIKWRHRTEVIVGTVEEIRAYVYNHAYRPATVPNYKFNTAGREGWAMNSGNWDEGVSASEHHTYDDPYTGNARNGWKVYFGPSINAQLNSPGVTWKAADFNKIYIRMAYTGAETQWEFRWRRNRQKGDGALDYTGKFGDEEGARYPDDTADVATQRQKFAVNGDGQFRIYEINLAGKAEWKNIINEARILPHARYDSGVFSYPTGEYAVIDWISNNPTGPAS